MRVLETSGIFQFIPKGSELSFMVKSVGVGGGGNQLHPQSQFKALLKIGTKAWRFIKKNPQKSVIIQIFSRGLREVKWSWDRRESFLRLRAPVTAVKSKLWDGIKNV